MFVFWVENTTTGHSRLFNSLEVVNLETTTSVRIQQGIAQYRVMCLFFLVAHGMMARGLAVSYGSSPQT